jgi:hypothetical protein
VAAHPPQEESAAERLTVSPPAPLLMNPQADIRRFTFVPSQEGHWT